MHYPIARPIARRDLIGQHGALFLSGLSEQSTDQGPINPHLRAVCATVSADAPAVSVSEKAIASASRLERLFKFCAPFPTEDRTPKPIIWMWAGNAPRAIIGGLRNAGVGRIIRP